MDKRKKLNCLQNKLGPEKVNAMVNFHFISVTYALDNVSFRLLKWIIKPFMFTALDVFVTTEVGKSDKTKLF